MGIFKNLLDDIKNQDPETIKLIKDTALYVESEHKKDFDSNVFDNSDIKTKEDLVHGHMVTYNYKKKSAKTKNGGERFYLEISILSIVQPLTGAIVTDENIKNMITNTLAKKLY